jgi:hypothetical protein
MTPTIPLEVLAVARSFADLDASTTLHAAEIELGHVHHARPHLAHARHLWRVDLPDHDELQARRDSEYQTGTEPMYTHALMAVFVVQLADGTYAADGAIYDDEPA